MKTHSNKFKEQIKQLGREIDSKVTYESNGETIELGAEELNSITPSFKGTLLKTTMKELEIDSNVEIPIGTILQYQFGLKVDGQYEYLNYGNYIVDNVEKQEDTRSWIITCYDKMLYSMKDYEELNITYPTTIREYIIALCNKLNLTFKNANEEFCNYDKPVNEDLFINQGLTFRDVLDQLAEVTGSIICINNNDELELRYIEEPQPSKNLLNVNAGYDKGYLSITKAGKEKWNSDDKSATFLQDILVEPGETYCVSANWAVTFRICRYDEEENLLGVDRYNGNYKQSITIPEGTYSILIACTITQDEGDIITDEIIDELQLMFEKGVTDRTEPYEPYREAELDTIDEEYLKDINVKFGEKYGPVNSIVLSRSAESDNIFLSDEQSVEQNGLTEIKIKDNQFMNFNDRDQYLQDLLDTLDGIEFYINDYSSTGVAYLELCDLYNVKVDEQTYKCLMLNDTLEISQGISEDIFTDLPEKTETDYKKSDKTDNRINKAYIIVDKQEQEIEALTSRVETLGDGYTKEEVNQLIQTATDGVTNKFISNGGNNILRNTGLWFENTADDKEDNPYEFWTGLAEKVKEDKASNMSAILTKNSDFIQSQQVKNGTYTLSFKYKKMIQLAEGYIQINNKTIDLTETNETEIIETGEVTSQFIDLTIHSDTDGGFIIYDLMLNVGSEKAEYSQNENETTTDTVNISKGITISSSDTHTIFRANSDGVRIYNDKDLTNPVTNYTDVGMDTNRINVKDEANIVKVLWKEVGNNTWISRL